MTSSHILFEDISWARSSAALPTEQWSR